MSEVFDMFDFKLKNANVINDQQRGNDIFSLMNPIDNPPLLFKIEKNHADGSLSGSAILGKLETTSTEKENDLVTI